MATEILDYIDSLTLSIDSIDNKVNDNLGRGINHYSNVKKLLDYKRNDNIKLNINTVVSKENYDKIDELGEFLNNYKIEKWKFFKFMPLRETAQKNKSMFEITDTEFDNFEENSSVFRRFENIKELDYRQETDIEDRYILILANGDIYKTENGKDIKKGNALYDNVVQMIQEENSKMHKIRCIVAYDNEETIKEIINSIEELPYIEVVGTATNKEEVYNKVIELKPEMVFTEYFNNEDKMELIKRSYEKLKEDTPIFNLFTKGIAPSDDELMNIIETTNQKLNVLMPIVDLEWIKDITKDYYEFKYN